MTDEPAVPAARAGGPATGPASAEPSALAPPPAGKSAGKRPIGCLIEIAETLVLTIVIFFLIQTFVAQPYQVEQQSMEATLLPGQYVLVDKLTTRFDSYSRGDIVVFNPVLRESSCDDDPAFDDEGDGTPFIKRVIGESGDEVELRDGAVLVNGVAIDEAYVRGVDTEQLGDESRWEVPPDRLFLMGDNRDFSIDSRSASIGLVCVRDVVGRAVLRYWPLNALGVLQTPTYPNMPPK